LVERGCDTYSPEAASLLRWWSDAGIDVLVDEAPRDWLRRPSAPSPALDLLAPPPAAAEPERPADEPLPGQLDLFHAYLRDEPSLPFAAPHAPRVCPAGDPASGLMMMVDMPAAGDCSAGALLTGEVGRLFDRMLAAIGRDRQSIYLAALSCLRSPSGQFDGGAMGRCATLARHHIGLAAPHALLLFGDAPAKALLGLGMAQARGRWHQVATHAGPINTLVTIPPHILLKQSPAKAHAWADLQMLLEGPDQ
jgi:uracil-DNA glycosylase